MKDIRNAAWVSLNDPNSNMFGSDVRYKIENAISLSVTNAIETLLRNIYTDDDFEQDLKLKD